MAVLYITEYADIVQTVRGGTAIPQDPPIAEQIVSISGTSAPSAPFSALTRFVRLHTDAICSVLVNADAPVATAASGRLAAGQTEFRGVTAGLKLAVITNT